MVIHFQGKNPLHSWNYSSKSQKGVKYSVSLWSSGEITCSCPASAYRKRLCWHRESLINRLMEDYGGIINAVNYYKDERRKKRENKSI